MNTIRKENRKIMFTKRKVFSMLVGVALLVSISPKALNAQESELYKVTTNKITAEAFYCLTEQDAANGNSPSVFLADISIVKSPDGEQLAIKINNDVLTIYTIDLNDMINAIKSGIDILAGNIKKPLKAKIFDPVCINSIFAFYSPATSISWYYTVVDIGTIYTNRNKSFYMYFYVKSSDIKDESYIMVCLDHDNIRVLLKDLQKYWKELPARRG